jgi:hypothetical protein
MAHRIGALQRIPLLTPEEAESVHRTVLRVRDHWTAVDETGAAFTLGTASYLAGDDYERRAAKTNPLLEREFGWLYRRLMAALGATLRRAHEAPVRHEPAFGWPGFQILVVNDDGRDPRGLLGGAHWDWNFLNMNWNPPLAGELELDTFSSFTLPIVLPRAGSGLRVWETLTSAEVSAYAEEMGIRQWDAIAALVKNGAPAAFHGYEVGTLVVHSGHLVHQVPPWKRTPGDARITLQGHGLLHAGCWRIYW